MRVYIELAPFPTHRPQQLAHRGGDTPSPRSVCASARRQIPGLADFLMRHSLESRSADVPTCRRAQIHQLRLRVHRCSPALTG